MAWNDLTSGQQFGYGSLIAQGISNTIKAFGSFGITRHQNAIAQSEANIARINAQMMEWQAQSRLHANTKDQVRLTMQAGKTKASQRAALAANGVAVGEGSAAELQASTDIIKEIDSNQLTENARREAWGMRMQAANYEGQALMAEAEKKNKWDVFGTTLLGGVSQVAQSYMLYNAMGLFDGSSSTGGSTSGNLVSSGAKTIGNTNMPYVNSTNTFGAYNKVSNSMSYSNVLARFR